MSEQGSLRYKKAKTALQEAQERLITNHMLDSANACQQGVEHISTLEAEVAEQAAEIAEIRETSKHINKIRMKEEAELSRLKADYSELLYQVQQKIPGETRHETAKRIIRQHEVCRSDNSQQAKEDS